MQYCWWCWLLLLLLQAESLVNHLASDMASEGIKAKTLTLKLKTTAFEVSRRVGLPYTLKLLNAMLPCSLPAPQQVPGRSDSS
jgi:hypothetical protein